MARTSRGSRGHNNPPAETEEALPLGQAGDRLRSLIERVERLQEERKALSDDIRDIFTEAKSAGFDVPTMRQIIRERAMEPAIVEERVSLLDIYRNALGMCGV